MEKLANVIIVFTYIGIILGMLTKIILDVIKRALNINAKKQIVKYLSQKLDVARISGKNAELHLGDKVYSIKVVDDVK